MIQAVATRSLPRRVVAVVIPCIVLILGVFWVWAEKPKEIKVILGGAEIRATLADTPDARTTGLSGHGVLAANEGMLFIFEKDSAYPFWMKDMSFPIDIIWFDSNFRLVYVKEHADPASYPSIFTPTAPARYVLEVPADFFSSHSLKVGDELKISR